MITPAYGKVYTTNHKDGKSEIITESFQGSKADWSTIYIEEVVRLNTVDELLTPVIDLISKMKNGHSSEITLTAKRTPQGVTVVKTHLVLKEKK